MARKKTVLIGLPILICFHGFWGVININKALIMVLAILKIIRLSASAIKKRIQ